MLRRVLQRPRLPCLVRRGGGNIKCACGQRRVIGVDSAQLSASSTNAQGRITFFLSFLHAGSAALAGLPATQQRAHPFTVPYKVPVIYGCYRRTYSIGICSLKDSSGWTAEALEGYMSGLSLSTPL